jgi:uncharacterized protein YcfJ
MDEHGDEPRKERDEEVPGDASRVAGGAASGAIVGTAVGGPLGTVVGATVGSVAGGAAEAADDAADQPDVFERTGQPGDERGFDLRHPRMGGHVGGSDPDGA